QSCSPIPQSHAVPTRRSSDLGAGGGFFRPYGPERAENATVRIQAGRLSCAFQKSTLKSSDASYAPKPARMRCRAYSAPDSMTSRSEEHTSELQSRFDLVCLLL